MRVFALILLLLNVGVWYLADRRGDDWAEHREPRPEKPVESGGRLPRVTELELVRGSSCLSGQPGRQPVPQPCCRLPLWKRIPEIAIRMLRYRPQQIICYLRFRLQKAIVSPWAGSTVLPPHWLKRLPGRRR